MKFITNFDTREKRIWYSFTKSHFLLLCCFYNDFNNNNNNIERGTEKQTSSRMASRIISSSAESLSFSRLSKLVARLFVERNKIKNKKKWENWSCNVLAYHIYKYKKKNHGAIETEIPTNLKSFLRTQFRIALAQPSNQYSGSVSSSSKSSNIFDSPSDS